MAQYRVWCKVSLKDAPKNGDEKLRSAETVDVEAKDQKDAEAKAKAQLKDRVSETCYSGKPNTYRAEKIG